jgi:hypothetical protein
MLSLMCFCSLRELLRRGMGHISRAKMTGGSIVIIAHPLLVYSTYLLLFLFFSKFFVDDICFIRALII